MRECIEVKDQGAKALSTLVEREREFYTRPPPWDTDPTTGKIDPWKAQEDYRVLLIPNQITSMVTPSDIVVSLSLIHI